MYMYMLVALKNLSVWNSADMYSRYERLTYFAHVTWEIIDMFKSVDFFYKNVWINMAWNDDCSVFHSQTVVFRIDNIGTVEYI